MKIYVVSKVTFTETPNDEHETRFSLKAFDSKEKAIAFISERVNTDRDELGLAPNENGHFWTSSEDLSTLPEGALVASFSCWLDTVCYVFEEIELV